MKKLSFSKNKVTLGFVGVVLAAGLAPPTAQAQDSCTCSGVIEEEPTPQLPPDCLELRDQAYREEQERYYARWQEISEWEQTALQTSERIYRDTIAVITEVRDESILIATGQYALKATAINAGYFGLSRYQPGRYHGKTRG